MSGIVVLGAQWGDEGKGKIVDWLASSVEWVVRFQGGNNAGHTLVVNGDEVILHLLPSGVLRSEVKCAIGSGVVVDPLVLYDEILMLKDLGIDLTPDRLWISPASHVIMPYHRDFDVAREKQRKGSAIGTTGRGIGPCYEDKVSREGIRMVDLCDKGCLKEKLNRILPFKNTVAERVYGLSPYDEKELFEKYADIGGKLKAYVKEPAGVVSETLTRGGKVLFEGAQGVLLDIDHGTYPYVTSSNTVAGSVYVGFGIKSSYFKVLGLAKAYVTRVGGGPFPSEDFGKAAEFLRKRGGEYGATTGRPRRCGWLDLVLLRYAVKRAGVDMLALTKLDVLCGMENIKIVVGYEYKGKVLRDIDTLDILDKVKPVFKELKGFDFNPSGISKRGDLPEAAVEYIEFIEDEISIPVKVVGIGRERKSIIVEGDLFF